MKTRYQPATLFAGLLTILLALGSAVTAQEVIYDQKPDSEIFNKDMANKKQRPFIVDKSEYPFKSNWFEQDGVSMHYIDEGKGIPIVLTHGNPDWSFLNRNIIKELSGESRVIAYDLPGFGFSDTPPDYGFTPQEHVEWISALLFDHLKLLQGISLKRTLRKVLPFRCGESSSSSITAQRMLKSDTVNQPSSNKTGNKTISRVLATSARSPSRFSTRTTRGEPIRQI